MSFEQAQRLLRDAPERKRLPQATRSNVLQLAPSTLRELPERVSTVEPEEVERSGEPSWFRREFPEDAARKPWHKRDEENRAYYEEQHAARQGSEAPAKKSGQEVIAVKQESKLGKWIFWLLVLSGVAYLAFYFMAAQREQSEPDTSQSPSQNRWRSTYRPEPEREA